MKVVLLQDVKNLGPKGKTVDVADGYARNYLFPRNLAVAATAGALKTVEQEQKAEASRRERERRQAEKLAAALASAQITVAARAGENGRLFGAVTVKDIADAVTKATGLQLDRRKLELEEPIKNLGVYSIPARLHPEVQCTVRVRVVEAKD
ncbi:MAG: 50S ribosomal protein L9 [Firmicutes bacterium]|nr:50S ribosomal protein L9 [Bacillota bacterium]